jgi:prevent-host-death family protein
VIKIQRPRCRIAEWLLGSRFMTIFMVITNPRAVMARRPLRVSRRRKAATPHAAILPAGRFKAICLAVMDTVQRTGRPVTVTKRGMPIVRVVPAVSRDGARLFGRLKGSVRIAGDVVTALDDEWDALGDE